MSYALGLFLGVVGASWHLAIVRWRAELVTGGYPMRSWLVLPLGLAGPLLAFFVALSIGGESTTWTFLVGALSTSAVTLGWARRPKR